MCNHHHSLHVHAELRRDPTRTTSLRKRFEGEAGRRFRSLKGRIRKELVDEDGFGLRVNRGRFNFPRSDQKVAGFMEWLRQAQRDEIIGVSAGVPVDRAARQAWTHVYVESAYQSGLVQAASRMRGAGATVEDRWINQAFQRPIHADRLGLAYTRAFEELEGITQAMDQQISRALAEGLGRGDGPEAIARAINHRVDSVGRVRARVMARTEVISAHAEASLSAYQEAGVEGVEVEAEFATAGDAKVCPECEALEGVVRPIDEAHGLIPVHPNCLPGDSLVLPRSPVSAASERVFDGDMIVFRTASGRSLTSTPNHPILTDRGWVASKDIDLMSHVVCDGGREWESNGVNGDHDDVVPSIHDVAKSFFSSGDVAAMPVPTTTEHFHGDGTDGEVAIIGTNRRLLAKGKPSAFNLRLDEILKRGRVAASGLLCFGPLAKVFYGARASANSLMSCADLLCSLGWSHFRPLQRLGLGHPPDVNTCAYEYSPDGAAVEPEAVGDAFFRLPPGIAGDDIICPHGHKLGTRPVFAAKNADDDLVRDAELARKLASGEAGKVFLDKVVSVDRFAFSGHVYNIETMEGWYSANGIITHNCRCAWIPKIENGTGIDLR